MNSDITANKAAVAHIYKQLGVAADANDPLTGKDIVSRLAAVETGLENVGGDMSGYLKLTDIETIDEATIRALISPVTVEE